MARDYKELLRIAQELQFFTGYLDTEDIKRQMGWKAQLESARRKFVYDLIREEGTDKEALAASVSADLDRIAASGRYGDGAVADVREELLRHIERQSRNGPFMRFVVRWGPPTLAVAAAIAYFAAQAMR